MSKQGYYTINSITKILDNLVEGSKYNILPPKEPNINYPSIDEKALDAQDDDAHGQNEKETFVNDNSIEKPRIVENFKQKTVKLPNNDKLDGVNVIGITGDNKRILTTSFHLILARTGIVNFKYTKGFDKPYFYTKLRDASSVLIIDENIFEETYGLHTYNELADKFEGVPIFDDLQYRNEHNKPFRFRFNYKRSKKTPNSQSLGLAVKFQHTLEFASLTNIKFEENEVSVCLKDGALYSNSTVKSDMQAGSEILLKWENKNRFFIAISNQISESRVLLKTLSKNFEKTKDWFPNLNITEGQLETFGTDILLLRKYLLPGHRTPMIEFMEENRKKSLHDTNKLIPYTCYYHKRSKPYSIIRVELPKFMWENDSELAKFALSVAIWQFELGATKPLVLQAASDRCNLSHDKWIIDQQLKTAFKRKKLNHIEF